MNAAPVDLRIDRPWLLADPPARAWTAAGTTALLSSDKQHRE
jgi:hypothetical protein